jgi:antitoxin FitA
MVALQIRDVDEHVRDTLAAEAAKRGQSLEAFLRDVLNDEARRLENVAARSSR